jgi:nicotinamide mononucleotide (NMN) deamidase PncC
MSLSPEATSMVKELISILASQNESLATAESITAGGLSSAITSFE